MEKLELKKRLEKKKAYFICVMLFLTLLIPTIVGICRQHGLSFRVQSSVVIGILMIIAYVYKKMIQLRSKIKTLFR